jgi:hypothetical protein
MRWETAADDSGMLAHRRELAEHLDRLGRDRPASKIYVRGVGFGENRQQVAAPDWLMIRHPLSVASPLRWKGTW